MNAGENMVFMGGGNASLQPGGDISMTTALHGRIQTLDFFNRDKSAGGLIKLEQNTHQRNTDSFSTVAEAERHHQEWQYTDFSTPRRKSMNPFTHPKSAQGATALLLCAALTACGGGSDSADNGSATGTISKTCAINGDTVSVTQEGCLASFGNNTHSLVCSGTNTLHMLTGTGLTRDQVVLGGSSITSGSSKIGLVNGLYALCI